MLLNTLQNIALFQQNIAFIEQTSLPQADPSWRLQDKRYLQAMGMITAEIERIRAMKKPSRKSYLREKMLEEMLTKAVGVDDLQEAEKALALAYRQRVSASIKGMLNRAQRAEEKRVLRATIATVKKESARAKDAKIRARFKARQAREQERARKLDTRRKIIIGGTVIAAIRDGYPGGDALIERIEDNLANQIRGGFRSIFAASVQEEFWTEFFNFDAESEYLESVRPQVLVRLYHELEAQQEKALDAAQSRNDPEQRQKRTADNHQKIIVGGAVLGAIHKGDSAAPALLQLLNERIGATRDRVTVRAILPIGEFRPGGRP